jgi:hypothetical protein
MSIDGYWSRSLQQMGGGIAIRDCHGRWIFGISCQLNPGNSLRAKLFAAEVGLEHAWSLGLKKIM